jgi:hypothetical protein
LFLLSTTERVAEPALFIKTTLPPGLIAMDEISPPNAPNAPLKALNRAVPFKLSVE